MTSGHRGSAYPCHHQWFLCHFLHHFWEAASCFLRSVMALSEDIRKTTDSRPYTACHILLISCSPDIIMTAQAAQWWESSSPAPPRAQEPPFSPLSASCLSSGNSKELKQFSGLTSPFRALIPISMVNPFGYPSLWLGGTMPSPLCPCLSLVLKKSIWELIHTSTMTKMFHNQTLSWSLFIFNRVSKSLHQEENVTGRIPSNNK